MLLLRTVERGMVLMEQTAICRLTAIPDSSSHCVLLPLPISCHRSYSIVWATIEAVTMATHNCSLVVAFKPSTLCT